MNDIGIIILEESANSTLMVGHYVAFHKVSCHRRIRTYFQHLYGPCREITVESSYVLEHGAVPLGSPDW